MLLILGSIAAFNRIVAAIMRTGRQLVHQNMAFLRNEKLDAEHSARLKCLQAGSGYLHGLLCGSF